MRFTRLLSAITLVAAVTVLGSCGESSTPTTAGTDPSANLGPREFTIAPAFIGWPRESVDDPIPTDTKTVLIGGIIPLASYPSFGEPVYSEGANNWLDIDTSPHFSLDPLGWIVSFKLKPIAQTLPEGSYTATIPVTVPAAINNPQMITISFGCAQVVVNGTPQNGNLTPSSPQWDQSSEFNNDAEGGYVFQDWCLFVPPHTTVVVRQQGDNCHDFTLHDPRLYVFTLPDHDFVDENDDDEECGEDGYDSRVDFTNNSDQTREYLLRAGSYCAVDDECDASDIFGTYRILANEELLTLRAGGNTVTPTTHAKKVKGTRGH